MSSIDDTLDNPMVRLGVGFCWLLAASTLLGSLLFRFFDLVGIFESFLFRRWWNLDRMAWIAIVLTLVIWVVVAILAQLEPVTWVSAAGGFFFWSVFVRNLAFELPDFGTRLVLFVQSVLVLCGVGLGLLVLLRPIRATDSPSPGPAAAMPVSEDPTGSVAEPAAAAVSAAPTEARAAGWYPDPRGEATWRWWDGSAWTDNTN